MGMVFELNGKQIGLSDAADRFNTMRKKYLGLSVEAAGKIKDLYDEKITGLLEYRKSCRQLSEDLFNEYLQIGVLDLITYGIYDVDEQILFEKYKSEYECKYEKSLNAVNGELDKIDYEQYMKDADRKQMIADAGDSIHTVGFISDGNIMHDAGTMISSGIEDAALNGLMAGGTALFTKASRKSERKYAEQEKENIFRRASTEQTLISGMKHDVYMLHLTLAHIINEFKQDVFYYVSDADVAAMESVCRNINRGNYNHVEAIPDLEMIQIKRVLENNPYNLSIYSYLLKKNDGITPELKAIIEYLCVDMESLADTYLREKYNLNDYSTYEEMVEVVSKLEEEMKAFVATSCEFYLEAVNKKQALFDIRRTFNGFMYESIEQCDDAREQYYRLLGDGVEGLTKDELIAKYYETIEPDVYEKNCADLQAIYIVAIKSKMNEFKASEDVTPYIEDAEAKKAEHNLEHLSLTDILAKRKKDLVLKEKIAASVSKIKDGAVAAAGAAVGKGKELVSKMPFGKKKADDGSAAETGDASKSIPSENSADSSDVKSTGIVNEKSEDANGSGTNVSDKAVPGLENVSDSASVEAPDAGDASPSDAKAAPEPEKPSGKFAMPSFGNKVADGKNGAKSLFSGAAGKFKSVGQKADKTEIIEETIAKAPEVTENVASAVTEAVAEPAPAVMENVVSTVTEAVAQSAPVVMEKAVSTVTEVVAESAPTAQPKSVAEPAATTEAVATTEPVPAAEPTPAAQPSPAVQTDAPQFKSCPQCGNTVKITGKFCGKCGHKF